MHIVPSLSRIFIIIQSVSSKFKFGRFSSFSWKKITLLESQEEHYKREKRHITRNCLGFFNNSHYDKEYDLFYQSLNLARPYKAYSNGYCEDTKAEVYVNRLKDYQVYSEVNCFYECVRDFLDRMCGCQIFLFSGKRVLSKKSDQ